VELKDFDSYLKYYNFGEGFLEVENKSIIMITKKSATLEVGNLNQIIWLNLYNIYLFIYLFINL